MNTQLWPASRTTLPDGAVGIGGVDVRALAAEFGTPLYVLDEAEFRTRAREVRGAFAAAFAAFGAQVSVYYAGKAFLCTAVARWAHEEGLGVDTASGGELAVALRAGVPGDRIGLHGNNKSEAELDRAVTAGVGRIVIDSAAEVALVAAAARRHGVRVPVLVRVTTGVHAGGHEYTATAHEDQKFGVSIAGGRALTVLRAVLARPELHLVGIHSHIGSQILDPSAFEVAARRVLELRAELVAATGTLVEEVDLGGGYGVAYLPEDVPLDPARLAKGIARVVDDVCAAHEMSLPRISIEPGRSIVGPAGVTLYTVGTVKPVLVDAELTRTYVSVDGGMSDNIRPALYGARYTAELVSRAAAAPGVPARVVGKHCESGDILVHDVTLPADIAAGDLLAVPATGAYGRSMASNYNWLPRPAVVAVRDGSARLIMRGETEADLLALDVG